MCACASGEESEEQALVKEGFGRLQGGKLGDGQAVTGPRLRLACPCTHECIGGLSGVSGWEVRAVRSGEDRQKVGSWGFGGYLSLVERGERWTSP